MAVEWPITIERGRAFNLVVEFGFDTTGMNIQAQLRTEPRRDADLLADFVVQDIDVATGKHRFRIPETVVATFPTELNNASYDITLPDQDGDPETWISGSASIVEAVTEVI